MHLIIMHIMHTNLNIKMNKILIKMLTSISKKHNHKKNLIQKAVITVYNIFTVL